MALWTTAVRTDIDDPGDLGSGECRGRAPDLARTTEEVFTLQELRQLLLSGRRLRMKYGVDLTAPELQLGHAVNLWLYRRLQQLGRADER